MAVGSSDKQLSSGKSRVTNRPENPICGIFCLEAIKALRIKRECCDFKKAAPVALNFAPIHRWLKLACFRDQLLINALGFFRARSSTIAKLAKSFLRAVF